MLTYCKPIFQMSHPNAMEILLRDEHTYLGYLGRLSTHRYLIYKC